MAIKITFVSVIVLLAAVFSFQVRAASLTDFPFMVHCEHSGVERAFYLAKVDPNGVAVYISPDRQAGTVTIDGPAAQVGGDGSGSCVGKTIKQLREAGQAFDLH
jgi:hypothetical protein